MHKNEPFVLDYEAQSVRKARLRKEKQTRLTLSKQARQRLKEEQQQKEREKCTKPKRILTVTHQPTYTCLRYKRLDGAKDSKGSPQTFKSKSEIQSMKSQTRIKNAINWLLLFADKKRVYSKKGYLRDDGTVRHNFYFRLAFITLTLSDQQKHTDEYLKKHLLQPFLYWLTRHYNALYVWKAESQLNGNLHFHITIDTFVAWKSVRAKWNKLLAKQGYCKVMQDGSNDRGNAATQIKAVCSEKKCANDIGGYMSKKDRVAIKDLQQMKKWLKDTGRVSEGYENAMVHCKWAPECGTFNEETEKWETSIIKNKRDETWYKRVIDGRLWGCSSATYQTQKDKDGKSKFILDEFGNKIIKTWGLSGVNIFLDETFNDLEKEEKIFFRQNPDIYNLGKTIIAREKLKHAKADESERSVRGLTDEDIEHRYSFMENVFIHPHLSLMKKGGTLQRLIHEEKLKRKKNWQKSFTDN